MMTLVEPEEQRQLEAIRASLECPCCSQLLQSPVMFTACSHVFCSVCIRRWLLTKTTCPVCNTSQDDQANFLVPCLAMGRVIDAFNGNVKRQKLTHDSTNSNNSSTLSKLPTLVYHVLSDEKLDSTLRSVGLPTTGSREDKITLHREYTLTYNAQVDSGASEVDVALVRKTALKAKSTKAVASFFGSSNSKSSPPSSSSKSKTFSVESIKPKASSVKDISLHRQLRRRRALERAKFRAIRVPSKWRAVFSDYLNKPVYYNCETKECTTERPVELEIDNQIEDSPVVTLDNEEEDDDDVIVVIENDDQKSSRPSESG